LEFQDTAGEPVQLSTIEGVQIPRWEFNLTATPRATALDAEIVGFIESITEDRINGWAVAPSGKGGVLLLRLFIDGEPVAPVECNLLRADVKKIGFATDRAGFTVAVPETARNGRTHSFEFRTSSGAPVRLRRISGEERTVWDFSFPPVPVNNELEGH